MTNKLLMIDDSEEDIDQVRRFLALSGLYELESCTNPIEAIRVAQKMLPDVIILDIMMDKIDGFGVIRQLERIPITQSIPIIIYSVVGDKDETILNGLGLGADHIVYKGGQKALEILELTITKVLKHKKFPTYHSIRSRENEMRVQGRAERVWVNDKEISLTKYQKMILAYLIETEGTFISSEELVDLIYIEFMDNKEASATPGNVYKYMYDLRNKIEPDPKNPVFIDSQRDRGYRLMRE